LLLVLIVPLKFAAPEFYRLWIDGELGLIELATPAIALVGAAFGISMLGDLVRLPTRRLRVWVVMVLCGSIYFAGEELSWGQHLVGWQTPEYFETINDQEETNLHNVSSWFDQKPRLALEVWVLVGGIIVPLLNLKRARTPDPGVEAAWFWPPIECFPTAVLAILVRLPERLKTLFDVESLGFELRFSEPQEYYFALFLALYLASIRRRLRYSQ
jgi:hypothetical protein